MNRKLRLTKRDVNLLLIMFFVAVIAGYWNLMLKPLIEKKNGIKDQLTNSQSERQLISSAILSNEDKKKAYENKVAQYNQKKAFMNSMTNEQISQLIDRLCEQSSLLQTDFTINTKKFIDINRDEGIFVSNITLQLESAGGTIFSFIESVDNIKNLYIDNFTISDLANSKNYHIVLSLYTINNTSKEEMSS